MGSTYWGAGRPISEWFLPWFDYSKNLVVEKPRDINTAVNWSPKGLLKVRHLGKVFQIYSKDIPGWTCASGLMDATAQNKREDC